MTLPAILAVGALAALLFGYGFLALILLVVAVLAFVL